MSRREIVLKLFGTLAIALSLVGTRLPAQTMNLGQELVNPNAGWDAPWSPATSGSQVHLPVAVAGEPTPAAVASLPSLGEGMDADASVESFEWPPRMTESFPGNQERLIDRIVDPTSWLLNFRFRESWNWPVDDARRDSEEFEFRPTIPFVAWDHVNILRITIPYNVSGSDPGLDDVTIFDVVVHEATWGRWGVGPVVRLTPGNGSDSFQIGPAAGAVSKDKHWTRGFLTQNFFDDGVAESRIQPILAYKFDEQWAVGVGEFEFRYDWEDADWTQVPLGVEVDYLTEFYGQKIQLFVNPQYNFESDASNSGWTVFLGLTLLVPEA